MSKNFLNFLFILLLALLLTGCNKEKTATQESAPFVVERGNITMTTTNEGQLIITVLKQGETPISDAECELDILREDVKVVDFRSLNNQDLGVYTFNWSEAQPGTYTVAEYCWRGETLDQEKIYSYTTITI
jgi:hypothetical protein